MSDSNPTYTYSKDIVVDDLLWESSDVYPGCECNPCTDTCPCACRSAHAVFECNQRCKCKLDCLHRAAQQPFSVNVERFDTGTHGFGLKTLQPIPAGAFVGTYVGEVLSLSDRRHHQQTDEVLGDTYLMVFQEHSQQGMQTTTVDARNFGNETRFINHSCTPNLLVKPVRERQLPRLGLFAMRDIAVGEELSFDYGAGGGSLSNVPCSCQSVECKGYMPRSEAAPA
eukprot:m.72334 g.72334  ORF g.72334 m.72334 type:complete len:226 (+) comp14252_c0_seq1:64-741(+)